MLRGNVEAGKTATIVCRASPEEVQSISPSSDSRWPVTCSERGGKHTMPVPVRGSDTYNFAVLTTLLSR